MSAQVQGIALLLAALLGSGGVSAYFSSRPARSTREGALIDQYQERYAEQEEKLEKQDKRIDELAETVDAMRRREITYRTYIYELIRHIEDKAGPPPPPLPADLYSA